MEFTVYDPRNGRVLRAVEITDGSRTYAPPTNSRHLCTVGVGRKSGVVLLPTEAVSYGGEEELVREVRAFIHRYVQLREAYEVIATH